jgi:two-component system, cell cycle sensor histidine kinase and response regulator CckA
MPDTSVTVQELLEENFNLKQKIKDLEQSNKDCRQSEKFLRKKEETFRELVENSNDLIYTISPEGVVKYISPSCTTHLGYPVTQVIGKPFQQFIHPDDVEETVAALRRLIETGQRQNLIQYRVKHMDGSWRWFMSRGNPVRDEAGMVVDYQGITRDITEFKLMEQSLKQSEEVLKAIFNVAPVGLAIGKDRIFHGVNKTWCNILGYSESDVIGNSTRMLYEDDEEFERVGRELNPSALTKGSASIQTKHIRKDGILRDISLTAALLQSESSSLFVVVAVEDITDRKQTEKALRESRRQLSDIIDFLPDPTFVIDREGKVITWNRAIEALTGITKEEMIGKGNYEYAIPFYGYRRPILIDAALFPDREIVSNYFPFQRFGDVLFGEAFAPGLPPGDIHLSGTASVLRNENGGIIAAIQCIRDNTERKRLEERLRRAETMEGLGRLAGGVAHDLNNVLGVLVGYSELLMAVTPGESTMNKYAQTILKAGTRGAAIVQDLLTMARGGVAVANVVNLNRIIAEYLSTPEFERLQFYHPAVRIMTELDDELLNVEGSPVHLGKTVMNLVSNAAEAVSGAGEVKIRTENRYLDTPIRGYDSIQEGDYAVLEVYDTGGGISADDINKIFEPFYTKKVMGRSGTGLGLTVVWGTVKNHKGYIDVQSEEGKGTKFTLFFPITRKKVEEEKKTIPLESYVGNGESILVVDDKSEQGELALTMLKNLGYLVNAVAGGEEAVTFLQSHPADLLVLDMIMDPGIDGLETYQRILEINPQQKAIIVSGFSQTERVKKAQELGAGAYVRKPYILEKLGCAVRKELDRKQDPPARFETAIRNYVNSVNVVLE